MRSRQRGRPRRGHPSPCPHLSTQECTVHTGQRLLLHRGSGPFKRGSRRKRGRGRRAKAGSGAKKKKTGKKREIQKESTERSWLAGGDRCRRPAMAAPLQKVLLGTESGSHGEDAAPPRLAGRSPAAERHRQRPADRRGPPHRAAMMAAICSRRGARRRVVVVWSCGTAGAPFYASPTPPPPAGEQSPALCGGRHVLDPHGRARHRPGGRTD